MDELINTYTIKELEKLENLNYRTIKKRYEYIPVKIQTSWTRSRYKYWTSSKDYMIKYVKLQDILKLLDKEIDFTFVRKKPKAK